MTSPVKNIGLIFYSWSLSSYTVPAQRTAATIAVSNVFLITRTLMISPLNQLQAGTMALSIGSSLAAAYSLLYVSQGGIIQHARPDFLHFS